MKLLRKVMTALEDYHKKYPKDTLNLKMAKEKAKFCSQNMGKRELLTPMYPEGGRRHVYLGLEAPSAAENGGSAKNRVTHTVTVLPFFFWQKQKKY